MSKLIPKSKKPLASLSVLEREREQKRLRHENEELIDQMGQASERNALPIVHAYVMELNQEERDKFNQAQDILYRLARNKGDYQRFIVERLRAYVEQEDIPKKYTILVDSSNKGIILSIEGTDLYGAFKPQGLAPYDLYAAKVMATRLGNTIARLEGHFRESEGGILLVSEKEFEVLEHGRSRKRHNKS